MKQLRGWAASPIQRRQVITLLSGSLILLALSSNYLIHHEVLHNILMALAAVLAGSDIAWRAWNMLRHRHISIELLVTVATVGALAIGEYWEAAAVTFLFMLGAYLEARTMGQTRNAIQDLLSLAPTNAIVLRADQQVEVLAHEVLPGETVMAKPGTKIPVDGTVIDGRATVDESAITGESMPVEKMSGEKVFAGTVNLDGLLWLEATGIGADTTLARIVRRVEEAQEEKAPTQRFIERFAHWYTPAIIGLSAVTYVLTQDIELALTLPVIGCPGALVISTPVSVVAGIGQAAKRGILIKGGEYLENAGKISALALDKTGTLTEGKPKLTDVIELQPALVPAGAFEAESSDDQARIGRWSIAQQEILYWAAIAEAGSEHPLARPILSEVNGLIPHADTFETRVGRGVWAGFQAHEIAVGSTELMVELGIEVASQAQTGLQELRSEGKTAVMVALDGVVLGVLGIADTPREAARAVIGRLRHNGLKRIVMLTGDNRHTAQAIARSVGIDEVRAELLPEDKLMQIRQLQQEGHIVAMVGDGINDAPALATANVGIAMGAAGTDVAIETADIALIRDDLARIADAITLSKATLHNIRQNVVIALVTVAALLAGVLLGKVHMAGGMFIHEASVLVVILNGMRLLHAI